MDSFAGIENGNGPDEQIRLQHLPAGIGIEPREDIAREKRQLRSNLAPLHFRDLHPRRQVVKIVIADEKSLHLLVGTRFHMENIAVSGQ